MYKNYLKRVVDFLCSMLGLIVSAPAFIVIAVLIKLSSKGPFSFSRNGWARMAKSLK
jgi:O-antigen biosynthesis protein WbqP